MVDEDFVMGYAVGYNDGVGSGGGSGVSLDDYPVFPKKFRFGDSDFYFLVGDINTGFYDALETVRYDRTAGAYSLNDAMWYRCLRVILCKGEERFAVFNANGSTFQKYNSPISDGTVYTYIDCLDDISCSRNVPSSSTGQWMYQLSCECHYDYLYSDGRKGSAGATVRTLYLYKDLSFNANGTVKSAPDTWVHYTQTMRVLNDGYYAELMDLMLTLPDINEEV